MDFKTYFFGLAVIERDALAARADTSRGLLNQVAYRNKEVELGFADVLCALSSGIVTLDDLPLTAKAQRQRQIREQPEGAAAKPRITEPPQPADAPAADTHREHDIYRERNDEAARRLERVTRGERREL